MLGEKLVDFRGTVTGQRVLPAVEGRPTLETSFTLSGTILGSNATMIGTYRSTVRPDGTLYGECPQQGLLISQAGEMAKSGPLNGMAVLYEWEVDAQKNAQTPLWEWK